MFRVDGARMAARSGLSCLLALLLLAGCAATTPEPAAQPRLRMQAQAAESDGLRRHQQGDPAAAAHLFAQAARWYRSMDDPQAAARNQLQQAQAELAMGRPDLALASAAEVGEPDLQIQALLLQAQAQLALGRVDAARALLAQLASRCVGAACAERGRFWLLRARLAWLDGQTQVALNDAEAALAVLRAQGEELELANAWRLIAAARLQNKQAAGALQAAQAALEIDRRHALPEKIARDWLLIGDILRGTDPSEARKAYQRARSVALAAGLAELAQQAADMTLKEDR